MGLPVQLVISFVCLLDSKLRTKGTSAEIRPYIGTAGKVKDSISTLPLNFLAFMGLGQTFHVISGFFVCVHSFIRLMKLSARPYTDSA